MKTVVISLLLALGLGSAHAQALDKAAADSQADIVAAIQESRDTGRLVKLAAQAEQRGAVELQRAALQRLKQLLPYNREVALELAQFYITQGNTKAAFNELVLVQSQGLYADLTQLDGTEQISTYGLWGHLVRLFGEASQPFGASETALELPEAAGRQASSVVRSGDTSYVAMIDTGEVWRQTGDAQAERFIDADSVDMLHAITGMAVDAEQQRLWLASAGIPQFQQLQNKEAGITALFAFDLESGALIKRYPVANDGQRHQLADVEVDSKGIVYAADQATPIVFRLDPSEPNPKPIGGSSQLSSLRAIALSPDEQTLYVADYALGLFGIRLAQNEAFPIAAPQEVNLGGIEDLEAINNEQLLIVQPGVLPQRLLLLELAANRTEVTSSIPLAASLPAFAYPLRAEIDGERVLLVGNSQLDEANPDDTQAKILSLSLEPPQSGQRMRLQQPQ